METIGQGCFPLVGKIIVFLISIVWNQIRSEVELNGSFDHIQKRFSIEFLAF